MAGNERPGDDDRRLTKAERREQARIQREEIQRKMARRRRNRSIGLALLAVAVVTIVVAVFLTTSGGGGSGGGIPSAQDLLKEAPSAAKSAGCDAVQETPNYDNAKGDDPDIDHTHIGSSAQMPTPPPLSSYPTTPPASGPHDPTPLPAGIYSSPPNIYSAIHSLEHGGTIIWYAPGTSSDQLTQLLAFYGQTKNEADVGQDRVIIAPFSYPDQGDAGQLPKGVQMALVAWHRLQTCANVNLAVAFDFTSQYSYPVWDHRTWKGVAREPGVPM